MVGCAVSVSFSFLLQKYNALKFLRVIGFHSLDIYCMQIIAMTIARVILLNGLKITNIPFLVVSIWTAGIILPIFFCNFCMRFKLWWLFIFRKPKEAAVITHPVEE